MTRADVVRKLQQENFPSFAGWDLRGADLSGLQLQGCNFAGADLRGANLTDTFMLGANLAGARLAKANLTNAQMPSLNEVEVR